MNLKDIIATIDDVCDDLSRRHPQDMDSIEMTCAYIIYELRKLNEREK